MSKRDRRIQALIRAHGTSIRRRVKTPPASTTVQECASQWPADPSDGIDRRDALGYGRTRLTKDDDRQTAVLHRGPVSLLNTSDPAYLAVIL
ncbi:hypothetical protein SNOG_11301 [Parastagonospora nodorum SN15]|uniref:Uncharacterized protein n=1 Tax=Phaeosphaeria nodorum (strain SN15 / ATCC MYA-4574 / FGSC 10173) TaxID=321614 RepID=Q0UAB3_PHANO|nr:hypothetical protein SNOG_11301 [Parastagonospora nodorum SN15]EAT81009.1 hypothetical protein SNOG_11301 [Parastagonospora nodorum SN15]